MFFVKEHVLENKADEVVSKYERLIDTYMKTKDLGVMDLMRMIDDEDGLLMLEMIKAYKDTKEFVGLTMGAMDTMLADLRELKEMNKDLMKKVEKLEKGLKQ